MLTSLYCQIPFLKPFQCRWTHPLLAHSNSPLKYVFWNILGTSYLPLYLSCIDYQVLKRNLVLFGGHRTAYKAWFGREIQRPILKILPPHLQYPDSTTTDRYAPQISSLLWPGRIYREKFDRTSPHLNTKKAYNQNH